MGMAILESHRQGLPHPATLACKPGHRESQRQRCPWGTSPMGQMPQWLHNAQHSKASLGPSPPHSWSPKTIWPQETLTCPHFLVLLSSRTAPTSQRSPVPRPTGEPTQGKQALLVLHTESVLKKGTGERKDKTSGAQAARTCCKPPAQKDSLTPTE